MFLFFRFPISLFPWTFFLNFFFVTKFPIFFYFIILSNFPEYLFGSFFFEVNCGRLVEVYFGRKWFHRGWRGWYLRFHMGWFDPRKFRYFSIFLSREIQIFAQKNPTFRYNLINRIISSNPKGACGRPRFSGGVKTDLLDFVRMYDSNTLIIHKANVYQFSVKNRNVTSRKKCMPKKGP